MDQSKVKVCTVPADQRAHVASLSWLGTEDLNGIVGMPAGTESSYSGMCDPLRSGLAATDAIHVLYAMPHMHQYGRAMKTVINRAAGGQDVLIDTMFDDAYQIWHDAKADVLRGRHADHDLHVRQHVRRAGPVRRPVHRRRDVLQLRARISGARAREPGRQLARRDEHLPVVDRAARAAERIGGSRLARHRVESRRWRTPKSAAGAPMRNGRGAMPTRLCPRRARVPRRRRPRALAWSAGLTGHEEASIDAFERLHQLRLDAR